MNAVYANKIAALPEVERAAFVQTKRAEYERDIDILNLAAELVVDDIVEPEDLRAQLIARLRVARKVRTGPRHDVRPV